MPFWRKDTEEEKARKAGEKAQKEMQEESIRALERGGLPVMAVKRIEERNKAGGNFFTSDLTSNEHLLTREAGYDPISQVMGSSFVKIGFSSVGWGGWGAYSGEVTELSHAHKLARQLAVQRLLQEAELLGADGVIGVRLNRKNFNWSAGVVEFTAIGTAIRLRAGRGGEQPFTSDLTGQEFWQLYEYGYWPCGLVMGNCTYIGRPDQQTRRAISSFFGGFSNQELVPFTQAFHEAKRYAVQRLHTEIGTLNAEGAVGMHIEYDLREIEWEQNDTKYFDMLVNFLAIGTAIKRRHGSHATERGKPLMMLNLASRKVTSIDYDEDDDYDDLDLEYDD